MSDRKGQQYSTVWVTYATNVIAQSGGRTWVHQRPGVIHVWAEVESQFRLIRSVILVKTTSLS